MSQYILVCGTHRPGNQTQKVVSLYEEILNEKKVPYSKLFLEDLPRDFVFSDSFGERTNEVADIIEEKLQPAEKLIVITPEYNGSFPGVLKAFLDGIPPRVFHGKKAALVGVASGRAGNLRGMDHLTDVFHHLKVEVFHDKIPISKLMELMNDEGEIQDQNTHDALLSQFDGFQKF